MSVGEHKLSHGIRHACTSATNRFSGLSTLNPQDLEAISILPDEFLAKVRDFDKKNLAIGALRKLLNGQVHSRRKRNVVQGRVLPNA